ncbi:hypothetical protein [Streptomyces sp. KL116D]
MADSLSVDEPDEFAALSCLVLSGPGAAVFVSSEAEGGEGGAPGLG